MNEVKLNQKTIIRFYDIDVDISGDEDYVRVEGDSDGVTIDDIETTLGELGWTEYGEQTPADLIEEIGADYISESCGFCIDGYNWEIVK